MAHIKKFVHFCIFICISSIFLMSHNTFAANAVFDLQNYTVISSNYRVPFVCTFDGNTTLQGSAACGLNTDGEHTLTAIHSNGLTWQMKRGDIVEFDIATYTNLSNFNNYPILYIGNGLTYNNLLIIDVDEKINDSVDHIGTIDLWANGQTDYTGAFWDGQIFARTYHFTAQVLRDFSGEIGLQGVTSFPIFNYKVATINGVHDNFYFRISNLYLWRKNANSDEASNTLKQEKQDVQNAADESESVGESSESSAESATTSLLSAIGGAVSVISSASPTNCKINGNMGHIDMGELDLCANPVPAYIQTIGSLIMIMICVPLAISLFNRFINLFRSFQN